MAVNPNTDFSDFTSLSAAQLNRFPRGVMGFVRKTNGNVTATTTITDISDMFVTFTAAANRIYVAHYSFFFQKVTTAGYCIIRATNAANVIYQTTVQSAPVGEVGNLTGVGIFHNLSAGTQTIKLRSQDVNATSTLFASVNDVMTLFVEDIGPA